MLAAPNVPLRQYLIPNGFAWASSSYRCNGYVPGQGLVDTLALRDLFVTKNDGLANSLCVKLAAHAYGAYLNEVRAQTGKALTTAQAEILSGLARAL